MTPGTQTGPGESSENLEGGQAEHSEKTTQVQAMNKYCDRLCNDDKNFKDIVKKYHQGTLSKDKLKEEFKKKLSSASETQKKQLGLGTGGQADIDKFLSETDCFNNQLLYEIENNSKLRNKAFDELIENCVGTALDEYELTLEQKTALEEALRKDDIHTLNAYLEIPKFRKTLIKRYIPADLRDKNLGDINFTDLHNQIANLSPTDPKTRSIQDVWSRLMGGFQLREKESPQQAFERIQSEGSEGDMIADYETFFACPDTLISAENKKRILDFLMKQYLALIPLEAIEKVDPGAAKTLLDQQTPPVADITTQDPERNEALKTERQEMAKSIYRQGLMKTMIATRGLSFKTKIKLLGSYGSARQLKQKNEFYSGRPGSIQSTSADFEKTFSTIHGFSPDDVMDHMSLTSKLTIGLKEKIKNIEKFQEGNVMVWKSKGPDGKSDMIGYYAIDKILGDDAEEENEIKLRFLGNNQAPLSPSGIPRYYTGPQFFDYLSDCSDSGEINFVEGGTTFEEAVKNDGTRMYTNQEAYDKLSEKYGETEVPNREVLNIEIDKVLYDSNEKLESDKTDEREIYEGMTLAHWGENELFTFQISSIDDTTKEVTISDGLGTGEDSEETMSFGTFINFLKKEKTSNKIFRVPTGKGKKFGTEQFNTMMRSETHCLGGKYKKDSKVSFREGKDGKMEFGEIDKAGNFRDKSIIKVEGGKRDIMIESINGDTVQIRKGNFKQTKYDKEKGVITQHPSFSGSGSMTVPMSWLWGYMQTHNYRLDKPDNEVKEKQEDQHKVPKLGWLNILKSAHSLGVILHGDLWNAPYKAWEEQHHKDHAFSGKLTAALAIEKLQNSGGPVGGILRWAEWPSLMIGDSNSSLQSYLNELVERIDGMGSHHRVKLIRKWGAGHFPDPKFMAAMFASMQIFGQLYPYDFDDADDPRKKDWYWYNNVRHATAADKKKFPEHMPPENEDDWPLDEGGNKRSEMSMIYDLMNTFSHPILRNLGRRFEKYMNKGHELLKDGGPGNLNRRTTMEEKQDWMVNTVLSAKPTEAFGAATDLWLLEGYPTEVTTMPYAAMMFGHREQQLLPATQEHLRQEFQKTTKVPMFAFAQNRTLGNTFRETSIAMAYTISIEVGDELKALCDIPSKGGRLHGGEVGKNWKKRFIALWKEHGRAIMAKLGGMKDPMLNLMINDRPLFEDLMKDLPEGKQKQYREVQNRSQHLQGYYDQMFEMQSSASHSGIRGSGFYDGDNFRFREFFDNGYPTMWFDWDGYIDANIEPSFVDGSGTTGDGVFNEMRGFLDAIPSLAKKMAKDMGFGENVEYISRISKSIYEKNVGQMHRLMNQAKFNAHRRCSYYNVSAMILGMADVRALTDDSMTKEKEARFADYKKKMDEINVRAKEIAAGAGGYQASIEYRTSWWKRFEKIITKEEITEGYTLDEVLKGDNRGGKKQDKVEQVSEKTLSDTESILTKGSRIKAKRGSNGPTIQEQVSETLQNNPQTRGETEIETETSD